MFVTAEELADLSAQALRIGDRIIRLRLADPENGSRAAGVAWIERALARLASCINVDADGSPHVFSSEPPYEPQGWISDDPFSEDCLAALREEFAELTACGNPYPLGPLADDPFTMDPPRLYNGKLMHPSAFGDS